MEVNSLLTLAIVLVAGVGSGLLVRRFHLPAVTGQILIGVALGPSVLGAVGDEALAGLRPITHFAISLIAVAVGNHLNIRRLLNARLRLSLLVLLELTITPTLVFVAVRFASDVSWSFAFLLAAAAVSTAPATILALVKESHARGVFVKTLVAAVALNNIACICLFEFAHSAARSIEAPDLGAGGLGLLWRPVLDVLAAMGIGTAVGALLVVATWKTVRSDRLATASVIAILLTAGIADGYGFSSLLACLFLGVALANLTPEKDELGHGVFANFETAIYAIFFTVAGMELDFQYLVPGGLLAGVVVIARAMGKLSSAGIAMRLARAPQPVRDYLGMALVPQAGVAVGLVLAITDDPAMSEISQLFLAVGLTSVTINEIIGPLLTRVAIARSGDAGKDRARLIDFIHEENILTKLRATDKEDAIRQLTDHLIRTTHVKVDRAELLRSVLERERDFSTCVGEGLAIPHGVLHGSNQIVGAMGLSHDGLDFETPDDMPVHCIVLLATPDTARDRHLEVIAALASAIRSDRNIQRQLYSAKSPAHAYNILHAEEAEDFNYFLEEGTV